MLMNDDVSAIFRKLSVEPSVTKNTTHFGKIINKTNYLNKILIHEQQDISKVKYFISNNLSDLILLLFI